MLSLCMDHILYSFSGRKTFILHRPYVYAMFLLKYDSKRLVIGMWMHSCVLQKCFFMFRFQTRGATNLDFYLHFVILFAIFGCLIFLETVLCSFVTHIQANVLKYKGMYFWYCFLPIWYVIISNVARIKEKKHN